MMRDVPLPDDLEDRAYEVLLDLPTAERPGAFASLLAAHPAHHDDLLRLQRSLAGAENALQDTGLAETPPPSTIGPYRLLRRLGEGGFGVVWLARQEEPIRRQVAVKLIRPGMDTHNVLRRFEAEREVLTRFDHPNIARVLDAGETPDGSPFLVTEYVDGEPLTAWCKGRNLSVRDRVALLSAVAEGVAHAHQRGVIHRDLKPSNVLVVDADGAARPKIIDFGIARALQTAEADRERTRADSLLGTPEYMSPEQAFASRDVDVRTDVYALGVMLFELLVGDLPMPRARWRSANLTEVLDWLRTAEAPRPSTRHGDATIARSLRGDLDTIVLTALAKDRDRRYASVPALLADLQAWLAHRPIAAGPTTFAHQLRKFVRRHRTQVAAALLVFVSLCLGLVASLLALSRARTAEAHSTRLAGDLRQVVSQYDALADVVRARELQRRAATLWPAVPERQPQFAAWLGEARQLLAGNPSRAQLLDQARARAAAGDAAAGFLADTLVSLQRDLDALARDDGLLATVAMGHDWATVVAARTLTEPAELWRATIDAIAESPHYGGLEITPQLGLVPLGPDTTTGLHEFAVAQSGEVPRRDDAGRLQLDERSALVLVLLPGGLATIGAQKEDPAAPRYDARSSGRQGAVQPVRLLPFLLGKHEATRAQWQRARMTGGAFFPLGTQSGQGPITTMWPAENLMWQDAASFVRRLDLELPTDAQWEYACRAGTDSLWHTGDDPGSLRGFANIAGKEVSGADGMPNFSPEHFDGYALAAPIGSFRPNGFGLHDMHGNVAEACADSVVDLRNPMRDGDGRRTQYDERVLSVRGGSFTAGADRARCGTWSAIPPDRPVSQLGVRVARPLR